MQSKKQWIFNAKAATELKELCLSDIVTKILANRVQCPEASKIFLQPDLSALPSPFLFRDMYKAVDRIVGAIINQEKILIFGDYDVDGITGTTIVHGLLRLLSANVCAMVPERSSGYGMHPDQILDCSVLIAVDNGTTAFDAAEAAAAANIDLIIADHHVSDSGRLPKAFAIINPHLAGETYPFKELCGAGIAFKLAWAIATTMQNHLSGNFRDYVLDAMAYTAIGTIADVVPLVDENRIMVRFGLESLSASKNPGLVALIASTQINHALKASDIAFQIAPRINAAGRMGEAALALRLLATAEEDEAHELSMKLDEKNKERKAISQRIFDEACVLADKAVKSGDQIIVLAVEGWHLGILGIVASKIVEHFCRPAVLIALNGDRGKGSARSVPGIDLPALFAKCRENLLSFGGHAAAAGLEITTNCVDSFRNQINSFVAAQDGKTERLAPLKVDAEVKLSMVTRQLVDELELLGPFGHGNESPLLCARGVRMAKSPRVVGKNKEHLQLSIQQDGTVIKAIGFGMGNIANMLGDGSLFDIMFQPIISRWNNEENVELELKDIQSSSMIE